MNVGELMRTLAQFDPNMPLLLAKDQEGNGFSRGSGISISLVRTDELDDCVIESLHDEESIKEDYGDDADLAGDFTDVFVLWP